MEILLVEEDGKVRELTKSLWSALKAEFVECTNGGGAFAVYQREQTDWVLMDIQTPQVDGLTATRQITTAFPKARVLVVTEFDSSHLRAAARIHEAPSRPERGSVSRNSFPRQTGRERMPFTCERFGLLRVIDPRSVPKQKLPGLAVGAPFKIACCGSQSRAPANSLSSATTSALLAFALAVGLGGGCRKPEPPLQPEVVAEAGGVPVTRAQLLSAWERRQRATATNVPSTAVLGDLVDEAAAYAQAQRGGFLARPEIEAGLRQFIVAKYREARQATNSSLLDPGEADVRAAYAANTNTFVRPPALNLAMLFHEVPRKAVPEKRAEARQIVAAWRTEILAAPDQEKSFAAMVAQHSSDAATRYRRGELGWLDYSELGRRLFPPVAAAAKELEVGGVSQPIETPQGFYLVRLLGRRPAELKPFAEVEPMLRYRLREQRRQATEAQFRAEVRRGLPLRTNLALLQNLVLTNRPAAAPPPAMPRN